MKKYMMIAAVAAVVAAAPAYIAFQAQAEDAAPAADAAAAVETKELTLADGTKLVVKGEEVFAVNAEGAETPAADGDHALADGTTVKTLGGKLVKDEAAAPAEAPAEEPAK